MLSLDCRLPKFFDNVLSHSESLTEQECNEIIQNLQNQKPRKIEDKLQIAEEIHTAMEAKIERMASNLAQNRTVMMQMAEVASKEEHNLINASVLECIGVQSQSGNAAEMNVPKKPFFHFHVVKERQGKTKHYIAQDPVVVDLKVPAKDVWRQTGFRDINIEELYWR